MVEKFGGVRKANTRYNDKSELGGKRQRGGGEFNGMWGDARGGIRRKSPNIKAFRAGVKAAPQ